MVFLPELRDRTFEEIDEMFLARLPASKFRTYGRTGIGITPDVQNEVEHIRHIVVVNEDKEKARVPPSNSVATPN
ncbi:hypothetical protein INS49_000369 [Diaporthe citri]|uniref:uncharacterized protein n=1 Tax=Diaporthe citri TaxID=83186 RepID=UPI001C80E3C7|nr:uncharacterized protein INS49_000369 [Diaporthe citri]KAG6366193.1 hypothetical protein INS49_000369 [Diaporthe citri]